MRILLTMVGEYSVGGQAGPREASQVTRDHERAMAGVGRCQMQDIILKGEATESAGGLDVGCKTEGSRMTLGGGVM